VIDSFKTTESLTTGLLQLLIDPNGSHNVIFWVAKQIGFTNETENFL